MKPSSDPQLAVGRAAEQGECLGGRDVGEELGVGSLDGGDGARCEPRALDVTRSR